MNKKNYKKKHKNIYICVTWTNIYFKQNQGMDTLKYNLNLYESLQGIKLLIPDPADVKSDYEEKLKAFEKPVFPFWTRIWPAALAMSAYLMEESNWIANKHVLELGAGIGLPSFTAARFAKSVVISDADGDADAENDSI